MNDTEATINCRSPRQFEGQNFKSVKRISISVRQKEYKLDVKNPLSISTLNEAQQLQFNQRDELRIYPASLLFENTVQRV